MFDDQLVELVSKALPKFSVLIFALYDAGVIAFAALKA